MELVIAVMMVVLLEAALLIGGRDSRDGNDWVRHPKL
jgi:hypothetical protein